MTMKAKQILFSGLVHGLSGAMVAVLIRGFRYGFFGFILGTLIGMFLTYLFDLIRSNIKGK